MPVCQERMIGVKEIAMEVFGTILVGISGVAWTIVYIELIRLGFREKACGMPLFALTLNFAWETIYGIDGLFIGKMFIPAQSVANVVWACFDLFILITWFRYGKQYLPERGKPYFVPFSVMALGFGFVMQFAFYFYCENAEIASIYSAFAQNAAMSVCFLCMLFERKDLRAQSMTIAVCKWIGTLTPTIYGNLEGVNIYILLTGIVCCVLDLGYIYFLSKFRKENPQDRFTIRKNNTVYKNNGDLSQ